ncbi:nitrophenyl compound nitroreductase subunit ArsF family protein, partial [Candidatus Latescibacterota bacterium]
FMTSMRCANCMKIESYTKEAVDDNFGKELGDGTLVWRMVAIDSPENEHFIGEYELVTKSVVLVKIRNGEQVSWENLDQVWTLLDDKQEFMDYITGEVRTFLETSS